jgi:excisionase family DNA binding protein
MTAYLPAQVAARWSVSRRHVYNLVASGALGHIRVGTLIRIREEDVTAYEARQWHAPVSTSRDTASSSAPVVTMSGGGRTTSGTAFQRGQAIAAKLSGSSPSSSPAR